MICDPGDADRRGSTAGVNPGPGDPSPPWAVALAVPALILQRRLISARFAALHDRGRMKGL